MRSAKYIEKLIKYEPVYLLYPNESLTKYMLYKGRLGTAKVVDEKAKIRVVYEDDIEYEAEGVRLTFTEYAKVIVYDLMDALGIKKFKNLDNAIYSVQPLYAKPGIYYNMVYVDISDAYYTIYRKYFYVQYKRGKYLSSPVAIGELDISKRVKRSIYGVMRTNSILRYERLNGQIKYMNKIAFSSTYNADLVNLINDILHMVAYKAVNNFNAVYFNTDGAILPQSVAEQYIEYLESIGFKAKIKFWGEEVEIKGVGAYRFDSIRSGTFDRILYASGFNNLLTTEIVKWLEKRIRLI
ncbi:MAG: hypothetical protein QXT86_13600 [Archaeoglobaceae archaeon]